MNLQQITKLKYIDSNNIPDNWKTIKYQSHSLHKICSRICSFPPELPFYFINKYSKVGDTVLDVFSGKGTVPLEACINNRIGIGNDVSPEAFALTQAKVNPVKLEAVESFLIILEKEMASVKLNKDLTELDRKAKIFFSDSTFDRLLKIKSILQNKNSSEATFTKAMLCGILHGTTPINLSLRCSHSYSMAPNYVKNYAKKHKLRRPNRDVIDCLKAKARIVLADELPIVKGKALSNDSRNLNLSEGSIDLIITSPPYFDVQTYAYDNWLRLWILGYDYRDVRKAIVETGSKKLYADFMQQSISEMFRVLKPGAHCFIVVGDVRRRTRNSIEVVNTAEFLLDGVNNAGFHVEKIINDTIPRGRKVLTHTAEGCGIKTERILHLVKP